MAIPFIGAHRIPQAGLAFPAAPVRIEFTYDTGFGNSLEIRGMGPGMSWDAGKALTWNTGNRWTLELPPRTGPFDYKLVFIRNRKEYLFEEGDNHRFNPNNTVPLKAPIFNESVSKFRPLQITEIASRLSTPITNPTVLQPQDRENTSSSSSYDSKIYDLVVGKIIPVLAAALAVGCVVLAFTTTPLTALGIIPLIAVAILGVFASNKEAASVFESIGISIPEVLSPSSSFVPHQPVGLRNTTGNNCWANSLVQLAMNTPVLEKQLRALLPLEGEGLPRNLTFNKIFDEYSKAQVLENRIAKKIDSQEIREYAHRTCIKGDVDLRSNEKHKQKHEDPTAVLQGLLASAANLKAPLYSVIKHRYATDDTQPRPLPPDPQHLIGIELKKNQNFDALFKGFFETRDDQGRKIQTFFNAPPPELLIQLRRISADGQIKDDDSYPVPLFLTLPADCCTPPKQAEYECDGFIEHKGPTPNGGHYMAYIKRAGKWWWCNDSTVTEVEIKKVQEAMKRSYIYSFRKIS